jgi:hypothetical protein
MEVSDCSKCVFRHGEFNFYRRNPHHNSNQRFTRTTTYHIVNNYSIRKPIAFAEQVKLLLLNLNAVKENKIFVPHPNMYEASGGKDIKPQKSAKFIITMA